MIVKINVLVKFGLGIIISNIAKVRKGILQNVFVWEIMKLVITISSKFSYVLCFDVLKPGVYMECNITTNN